MNRIVVRPRLSNRLHLLTGSLIWTVALIIWMVIRWDAAYGAVRLVEDRAAIAVLTLLAFGLGLAVGRWVWPLVVAGLWIGCVGATQIWINHQIGEAAWLAHWRVIAPTFTTPGLFIDNVHEFNTKDIDGLLLAGLSIPVLGAWVGVLLSHWVAEDRRVGRDLALVGFAGLGFLTMALPNLDIGTYLLIMICAAIAGIVFGAVIRQWRWVAGPALAMSFGPLLWLAMQLQWRGIEQMWIRTEIEEEWFKVGRGFADVLDMSESMFYVLLPVAFATLAAKAVTAKPPEAAALGPVSSTSPLQIDGDESDGASAGADSPTPTLADDAGRAGGA